MIVVMLEARPKALRGLLTLSLILMAKPSVCYAQNPVLMISFDGFRYDYLDKVKAAGKETPHFNRLIRNGVQAEYMKNAFITKTFPNHYSLATGMYEESHGVVSNNMFDPRDNETFVLAQSDVPNHDLNKWFTNHTTDPQEGPEPIWVTNQKAENWGNWKRASGTIMWPGSAAEVHGILPQHFVPYNRSVANETRIDTMVEWLSQEDPINLGLLYFSEPDHTGHEVGPDSPRIVDMIVALDGLVGYLIEKLEHNELFDQLNLIITSDHGMESITNATYLDDAVSTDEYEHYGGSPVLSVRPTPGNSVDDLYNKFKTVPHMTVYKKSDIPEHFHYKYNVRVLDLLLVADNGWQLCPTKGCNVTAGNHGFSNEFNNMHPFFIAHGPAFRSGFKAPHFNNVDVYPLLCKLLDLTPWANNGSLAVVETMLAESDRFVAHVAGLFQLTVTGITFLCAVLFAASVSGMFAIAALRGYRHRAGMTRTQQAQAANRSLTAETENLLESEVDEEIA